MNPPKDKNYPKLGDPESMSKYKHGLRVGAVYGVFSLFLAAIAFGVLVFAPSLSSDAEFFFALLLCTGAGMFVLALFVVIANLIFLRIARKSLMNRDSRKKHCTG